jgi:predicted DNA-binding transcriptional regulator AlpA
MEPTQNQALVRLLTDRDVSAVTGTARSTLAKMRLRGDGPLWVRVGVSVRYPEDALRDWVASLPRRRSTSEVAA